MIQALGLPLAKRVKDSRVLVVGAGGIGCELLKNLVCAGFGSGYTQANLGAGDNQDDESLVTTLMSRAPGIVLVDLDTIDLSNLNRQFPLRLSDGASVATHARGAVRLPAPGVKSST